MLGLRQTEDLQEQSQLGNWPKSSPKFISHSGCIRLYFWAVVEQEKCLTAQESCEDSDQMFVALQGKRDLAGVQFWVSLIRGRCNEQHFTHYVSTFHWCLHSFTIAQLWRLITWETPHLDWKSHWGAQAIHWFVSIIVSSHCGSSDGFKQVSSLWDPQKRVWTIRKQVFW